MTNEERQPVRDAQRMYDKFKQEMVENLDRNLDDFYRNLMAWCIQNGASPK